MGSANLSRRAVPFVFDISSRWLGEGGRDVSGLLRLRVIEGLRVNHLDIDAGRARTLRVSLAYALAEGDGAPEVIVEGVPFALSEAEAFDDALAGALMVLDSVGRESVQ